MNAAEAREAQEAANWLIESELGQNPCSLRELNAVRALIADDREARELLAWMSERVMSGVERCPEYQRARALLAEPEPAREET